MSEFLPSETHKISSPVTNYGRLVLSLPSQCRWPLDVPSSPLRRYAAPQINALYATASYCPPCTNPTGKSLLFCSAIPSDDSDLELLCLLSYCLLDYFCCCR